MHRYFIKTPWLVRQLFPSYTWRMPAGERTVYLTFDDGPHPLVTPWVLDELKQYEAAATFFCIGNNVRQFPALYQRILDEGHATGNHTFHHRNGWKTAEEDYLADIRAAASLIRTNLFRPPYGRIRPGQAKRVDAALQGDAHIIMWDVLSADFDPDLSPEACYAQVADHVEDGSIIVFHDSEKAFKNLRYALPQTLAFLKREGYRCKKIEL